MTIYSSDFNNLKLLMVNFLVSICKQIHIIFWVHPKICQLAKSSIFFEGLFREYFVKNVWFFNDRLLFTWVLVNLFVTFVLQNTFLPFQTCSIFVKNFLPSYRRESSQSRTDQPYKNRMKVLNYFTVNLRMFMEQWEGLMIN